MSRSLVTWPARSRYAVLDSVGVPCVPFPRFELVLKYLYCYVVFFQTWSRNYRAAETEPIVDMDFLVAELLNSVPAGAEAKSCLVSVCMSADV